MDGTVKVWDSTGQRRCRRTYEGHSESIKQVRFDLEGRRFGSAGYDKHLLVWDVETGACTTNLDVGAIPYCVTWYPRDSNILLAGCSNRRIKQWDLRSGECVLEYDYHQGTVNTVTFYDGGRRFVSSSDDKRLLCWEFDTPTPIKYFQDPTMYAVPAMTPQPHGTLIAGQCMDNTVTVYDGGDRFRQVRKKTFKGHVTGGYACVPGWSPNGRFLTSGDGSGRLWIWDFKSKKVARKLEAHKKGPVIDTVWHPIQPSLVFTAGWDGVIKAWE
jgi:pre-mRNA-processing factor 17